VTRLSETLTDPFTPAEFQRLAELGFVAAGKGWLAQASQLFNSLIELEPQHALPHVGLALAFLNGGHPDDALRVLERADKLVADREAASGAREMSDLRDESALIRAFYGVALKLAGRTAESFRILQALSDRPGHDHAGRIARSMLGVTQLQEVKS
jgi:predicted Zn-dependent protease